MRSQKYGFLTTLIALTLVTLTAGATAQTFTTLASFDGTDGRDPSTPLVQGTDGNFYGTTGGGGAKLDGVIFRVTPSGSLTLLYTFCSRSNCSDGTMPFGGLALGANGNLYGTTEAGGAFCPTNLDLGCGTVFEITPAGKLTTLYRFCAGLKVCTHGAYPQGGLLLAGDGNFYGTTYQGGANNSGTVYKITPQGKVTTLYSFCSLANCADGAYPVTGLVDSNGTFYGTTYDGGAVPCSYFGNGVGCGTIFSITPSGTMTTLHSFATDAGLLQEPLALASNGNFYGTSVNGGTGNCKDGCGTVFEITPSAAFSTLYSFCVNGVGICTDGAYPMANLMAAADGNLYGETSTGGTDTGSGTIFKVTPEGAVTTLHNLSSSDGSMPDGGLLQSTDGNFYGTTNTGGTDNQGTVFKFSVGLPPFVAAAPSSGPVGAKVVLLGNNLTGTTGVSFNGTSAKFRVVSSTQIVAAVPAGAISGPIQVSTLSGPLDSNVPFRVIP